VTFEALSEKKCSKKKGEEKAKRSLSTEEAFKKWGGTSTDSTPTARGKETHKKAGGGSRKKDAGKKGRKIVALESGSPYAASP